MKKTKVIIPALGILLLSTAASVTGTVAWFSANSTVTADGMQVKAKAESALVIADSLGTTGVGTATEVHFTTAAATLVPATHKEAVAANSSVTFNTATGLEYNTNPSAVDASTGYAAGTQSLTFADVAPANVGTYAVDYSVFIAAAGAQKTLAADEELTVKIGVSSADYTKLGQQDGAYDTWNALTVDFYVSEDTEASGKYAGSLNLQQANLSSTSYDSTVALVLMGENGIIPKNNSTTDYLRIMMRVYFNGALEKSNGQAYIYSDIINTDAISFSATFKVE